MSGKVEAAHDLRCDKAWKHNSRLQTLPHKASCLAEICNCIRLLL